MIRPAPSAKAPALAPKAPAAGLGRTALPPARATGATGLTPAGALALQRALGNGAVARLLDTSGLSPYGPTPDAPTYGPSPTTSKPPGGVWGRPVTGQPVGGTPDEGLPETGGPVTGRPVGGTPDEGLPETVPDRDDGFDRLRRVLVEWRQLTPIHHFFSAPSFETYKDAREAFLIKFGWPAVSEEVAIDRAIAYYTNEVQWVTFMGRRAPVHRRMQAALETAQQRLDVCYPLQSFGGANIRFNVNAPGELSLHSFGWAIDINQDTSPNTKDLKSGTRRAELIAAITGIDVSKNAEGGGMSTEEQTAEEMLDEAERLAVASDRFVEAFADEDSLAEAGHRIAADRGLPEGGPEEIGPLMFAAADESTGKQWRYEPYEPPVDPGNPQKPRRDAAHQALARFVFPADTGDSTRLWDEALVTSTVKLLAYMARVYRQTLSPTKRDPNRRVGPTARSPSDAQLAVHGFMSIPPELVAALTGSDAANLKWLGMNEGATKDYMHFELRDRPALY